MHYRLQKILPLTALIFLACPLACSSAGSQNNTDESAIKRYESALQTNANDHNATDGLKRLIDRPNPVSDDVGRRIREILRTYARAEKISLINEGEPGEKLTVKGIVRNARGEAVPAALIYVFQTDAQGHYTRASVMNEPNARIFGFLKTNQQGRYEFSTIRPGGYPSRADRQGEQWHIPQHIHFQVSAPQNQIRNFQMVFEDDPRMTPYWHDWAKRGNHIVVKVIRISDSSHEAVCDIVLQPS